MFNWDKVAKLEYEINVQKTEIQSLKDAVKNHVDLLRNLSLTAKTINGVERPFFLYASDFAAILFRTWISNIELKEKTDAEKAKVVQIVNEELDKRKKK